MSISAHDLLRELDALEEIMAKWQTEQDVPDSEISIARRQYMAWYGRAINLVPEELKAKFRDAYEGSSWTPRIRAFLNGPFTSNVLLNPDQPNPLVGPWQYPFATACRDSLSIQKQILYEIAWIEPVAGTWGPGNELTRLAVHFSRIPETLGILQARTAIQAPKVEKDLQAILHALLSLMYADVRPEAFVSEFAGANSRVDFLLPEVGVVFEAKMLRESLSRADVGAELLADWIRYQKHPDCCAIFALIYDPRRLISNAAGLAYDLSNANQNVPTRAIVVR